LKGKLSINFSGSINSKLLLPAPLGFPSVMSLITYISLLFKSPGQRPRRYTQSAACIQIRTCASAGNAKKSRHKLQVQIYSHYKNTLLLHMLVQADKSARVRG
jgi:hypothetical protein